MVAPSISSYNYVHASRTADSMQYVIISFGNNSWSQAII